MGRRAPFVLAGLLFLLATSIAQDIAVSTKARGAPAVATDLARLPAALANKRARVFPAATSQARANYARLPLSFEPNQGQAGEQVQYLARGGRFNVFLTRNVLVISFGKRAGRRRKLFDDVESDDPEPPVLTNLEVRLQGASPSATASGVEELLGKANYLVGRNPQQWHVNVPTFAKVRYRDVYPGVDLLYYGNQGELESDFVVAPGANPEVVKLSVAGAEAVTIDAAGDAVLRMKDGALRLRKPFVYQETGGARRQIAGNYVLAGNNQLSFKVAQYDHSQPLVIDPVLSYSTYLGGNSVDEITAIAVDSAGNAYVTGDTTSTNFPTTLGPSTGDMFVAKLDPNGAKLYATYAGGNTDLDFPTGIGVDVLGNAYIAGQTAETNLPTTAGALRTTYQGGPYDGFVFSLNSTGSGFNYFTYLGGSGFDLLAAIAVDSLGNAYLTGQTSSGDYPTASPFETVASIGDGGIFSTTNSGTNWTASNTGLVNKNVTAIALNHPSAGATAIYAATQESGVIKSTDSGATWTAINSGLTTLSVNTLVLDPVTPTNVYIGTTGGGVFASTNGGTSWTALNTGLVGVNVHVLAIDPTNPGTLYAHTGKNGVYKFSGSSWAATGALPADVATGLIVDPTNNQNVYVAFQTSGVYRSTNGGASWSAFNTGLSNLQMAALAIDHAGRLYAGTRNGGVSLSTGGGSWTPIDTGLPLGVFQALATDPTNNTTVYVGTWNGGVYRSANNGASWSEAANNGLNNTRITSLAIDPLTPTALYAGSQNVEVVVTKLNSSGALVFSSFLGGGGGEAGLGIAIDGDNGNLYLTGFTNSLNFPTVAAAQTSMVGGSSGFVSKVKSDGSGLAYSTYIGGPLTSSSGSLDQGNAIAADANGNGYVTGLTNSTGFPVTNATQATLSGTSDAFVAKYNSSGQQLFATYLGGEGTESGNAITVTANTDGSTTAWVAGQTTSEFFPLANPLQFEAGENGSNAAFVSGINFPASGSPLMTFSTYLGEGCGPGCDTVAQAIGHDGTNNVYIAGRTASGSFPTVNAVQPALAGAQNAFIAKIASNSNNADLNLILNSFTPSTVVAGGTVSFSLTVINNGPNDATNVSLGGRGGANLTIVNCTVTQGICGDNLQVLDKGFAELGTLANGASATVSGTLRPLTACGASCPYLIVVNARSDANDPNPANNSISTNLTVLGGADLGVTLSESPAEVQVGGTLTYTGTVTNLGPSTASNVTAVITLSPSGAGTFVTPPSGCTPSSNTLTCVLGPMNAGSSSVGQLPVTVNALPITATITVSNTPEGDPNLANNTATVSTSSVERFLITDFDNNALRIFNLADSSSPSQPIRTGRSATGVAVSPNRRVAYVGNLNSDYASVIDLTWGREIARIHGLRVERNLALSRDGTILVAPDVNTTGLAVVDASSFDLIQNVPLADALGNPGGSDFLGSVVVANNLAFVNTRQANLPVVVVDLELLEAGPIGGLSGTGPAAGSIAATPDGSYVLAIRQNPNNLYVINTSTLAVKTVSLSSTPTAITVVPNPTSSSNTFGFVAHSGPNGAIVSAIDLRSGSATFGQLLAGTDATLTTFGSVRDITSSSDGSRLVAIASANGLGDNVAVLDATPVRGCSNQPAACAPATVLSHGRLGDTQSGFTSVIDAFADTTPPSTAPTLSSPPTPSAIAYGSGTTVTITGTNFASDTFVRFGTSDPVAAALVNPTTISVAVPANTPAGSLDVTVTARGAAGAVGQQNQSTLLPQSFFVTNPTSYHPLYQAMVADTGGDEVDFLDVLNQATIGLLREQLFNLGDRPLSAAMSQDGTQGVATSFASGNLDFFNASVGSLESTVLLLGPYGSNGGNIFGQNDALAATVYPPTGEKVMAVLSSQAVAPVSDVVKLIGIDPNNGAHFQQTVATFNVAAAPGSITGGIAAAPDGSFLYANDAGGAGGNLVVVNASNGSSTVIPLANLSNSNVTVSGFQPRVYVAPDGKTLLLATDQGPIAVFDISGSYVSGASATSPKLIGTTTGAPPAGFSAVYLNSFQVVGAQLFAFDGFDSIVQMYSFNPAGASFALEQSFVVPGEIGFLGADLAVTPDASLIYAVLEGQDQILVLDANAMLAGSANPVITRMATGANPIGIAVSPTAFPQIDLAVSLATNPSGSVAPNGSLTYTITVNDKSATAATQVAAVAAFTPSLTVSSVTTSSGTCTLPTLPASLGSIVCQPATITQGTPVTITVAATAPATAQPCSNSSLGCITAVASAAAGNQLELNPADNTVVLATPISTSTGATACTGTTTNWLGGTGNWSDSTKWSTGVVPNSGSVNVCIANGNPNPSQVTLDISAQVANLYIDSNASLTIGNGNTLVPVAGTVSNAGNITIAAGANNTFLSINGGVTLTGGGTLTLSSTPGGGTAIINEACNCGAALTNANNTIQGVGIIGNNGLPFSNQAGGTVNANGAGTLLLNTGSTSNLGTLEATGGGTLQLNGTTFVNAGGTVAATGSGSTVQLVNATIRAGTVSTSGGGVLGVSNGNTGALDGSTASGPVTVSGTYTTADNSTTVLLGTINNTGNILVSAGGNATQLRMSGAVTLTGGGTLTLTTSGAGTPMVNEDCNCGAALTNANNTIQGVGLIGNDGLPLVNQAAGVINANVAGANSLVLKPGNTSNQGLMTATAGGTLQLNTATFVNASGTISASGVSAGGAPSTVQLASATIQGGTINTAAGGVLGTAAGNSGTLDGSTANGPVSNLGTYTSADSSSTFLLGTINNTGTMLVNAVANATQLRINGAVSLTGGGTLTLSSTGSAAAVVNAACNCGAVLTNASNLIQGWGVIGLQLVNQATINANISGQTLTINGSSTTNAGVLEATGGGILALSNNTINNQHGSITVNGASSAVQFVSNVTIQGGTLSTTNGGVLGSAAGQSVTLDGQTLGALTNSGTYTLADASTTVLLGTISNPGTILVNAVSNATQLRINGAVSLQGAGTLTLSSTSGGGTAYINEACNCGAVLTNVGNLIQGAGVIGNNGLPLVNQAVINANVSGQTLTINGNSTANAGLLQASGGGILALSNNIISNQSGTITVNGATSAVQFVNNVTIQGGSLNTLNGGVLGATAGQSVTLDGHTLGALTNNGTYTAADGSQTFWIGNIINPGTFLVNAAANATQLRMNGAVSLTGNGTVTMSSTGSGTAYIDEACNCGAALTNAGNLIQGAGVIGNNGLPVLNQATINANAAGQTLTLNGGSITNAGLLEAAGGGTLALSGDTINNQNGTITVNGATSVLQLVNNVTIQGGSLNALNGGALGAPAGHSITLDGSTLGTLTNNATFTAGDGSQIFLLGTINNLGAFRLNAAANATQLRMNGPVTLTGAGTVILSTTGAGTAYIDEACNCGAALTNTNNLIQGAGVIGNNGLPVLNQATINASVPGQSLVLNGNTFTNKGLLEATAGALLQLSNTTFANANATIAAAGSGSTVQLLNSTVQGGALTTSAGGVFTLPAGATSTLDGSTANGAVNNATTFITGDGSQLFFAGTINNTGAIQVNAVANATQLRISGAVSLAGAGTVTLSTSGSGTAYIDEACNCGAVLTNVGNTIQGVGVIGNNGLPVNNQGTITANLTGVGAYSQTAGSTVIPASTTASVSSFAVGGGIARVDGTLNAGGGVSVSGTGILSGTGVINNGVSMAGVTQPGDAPSTGVLSVSSYTQSSAGALNIPIGGATAGAQFSQLNVSGAAGLSGTLNVALTGGFNPAPGNSFTIVKAGSISGTFATVNLPSLSGATWQVTYNSTSVVLSVITTSTSTTLYSTGFENPPFTLGNISGQDGWQIFGPGSATVENTLVQSGSQAVSVAGSASGQSGPYHSDSSTGPVIELSAGIYIAGSSSQSEWQFAAMGPNLTSFIGGVNIFNGQIQAITANLPLIATWNYNAWNDLDFLFNVTTQTYSISVNGSILASGVPFCGDNGPCAGAPVTTYGTTIFDTFGGGNDTGYIDNVSLNNRSLAISAISPTSATAGGAAFTLTVNGAGFVSGSTVNFNGNPRTTTFVSATQLTTAILASDIATAGNFNVTVINPASGGTSNAVSFTVNNPAPAIGSLAPLSVVAGSGGFTLTVNGTGFVSTSAVNFNGSGRATTFVSSTQLTATILASDVANAGNFNITVVNPAPGGGTSSPFAFTVIAPNPVPAITTLSPSGAVVGGSVFTLTVNGTGFISSSVVNFGGNARTTTFVSATQLTAAILASDIAAVGSVNVTVTNPAPGGGTSNAVPFAIAAEADLAVTMTVSAPTVPVFGSITYQITVTDNGPDPATGVTLTDTLPANTVFASIDDLTDCAVSSAVLHCNFGTLAVGSSAAKTVNLILVPLAVPANPGTFDNTATVSANEFDPTTANNSATQTVQVTGTNLPGGGAFRDLPGLFANVLPGNDDDSAGPVPMNLNLNFFGLQVSSVFVNNNGNVTFGSPLGTFTPFPLTTTNVPIIAPFFADVETDFPTSGQVTYGNDTVNGRPAFGVDWPGVEYCCGSDPTKHNVFQVLLVDRSDVGTGDFDIEFNYDQIQWETGDASGGSGGLGGSSARVGYSNGSQTAGSFFELPGSGVPSSLLDTNIATGLIYNSLNSTQPGRYVFQVRGGTVQSSADLAMSASGPLAATAGSIITYTLTATNLGPNAATGVTVADTLPVGFTLVSVTPSGICSSAGQPVVVTCNVGTLANGANAIITIQAGIPFGTSGSSVDTAVVAVPNNQDLNLANNTATVTTNVTNVPAVLSISKSHAGNFAQGQSGATYTITVGNAAGAGVTNGTVTVSDTVPTGLTATAIGGDGWTCPILTSCSRADNLAAGASYPPITLTADVAFNTPASVTNSATVSGGGAVNSATANDVTTIIPAAADLSVALAVVPSTDASGTTISYAITLINNGPSAATSVQLTDQIVGSAAFVSASSETMTCPAPTANSVACTLAVLNNGASAVVNVTVNLTGPGWDSNTVKASSQVPDQNFSNNLAAVQRVSAGGNTVTGSEVAVQPVDATTGASPAILTFTSVTRGGTTSVASAASGPAPPAGFRTGTPAVYYNLSTTAGYSGAIGVALGFNGVGFHHPAKVRLFHYESGAWVDRTVTDNPTGGYAVAQVSSLSPFALFEPVNHVPDAKLAGNITVPATTAQGAKVTLNGSASFDADGDALTYRWTGPFPEGNGVATGVSLTVTMPIGVNAVTLVVNDGEADSKPTQQVITITDFSVAAAAAGPTTVTAGASVKFNITASQQLGAFATAIELSCLGLPQGTQCSFSPNSVNAGAAAATLTISTTARTSGLLVPAPRRSLAPLYALWMPLPAIAMLGLGVRSRKRKKVGALMFVLLIGMMLMMAACGGGSIGTPPQQQQFSTPAGTYTVTVMGTASGTLQHMTAVTFTVQ